MGNARYEILKAGGDKAEYLELIAAKESSMNPNAKNPTKGASASGLFQFTKGTWKSMVEQMGKDYDLADRFDPAKATEVALYLTNENEKYLKNKLGRDVTMTELYTAHVMGAPRGVDFIQGHNMAPDTEAAKYFEKESEWNKALFFNEDGSQKSFKQVNKWFTLDTPKNETLEQKQQRARDIRNSTRTIVPEMNESSHLMGYSEDDGKYYAHPTLFPRKQGDEPYAVEDWIQPEDAFNVAKERGELFEFETEQEAIDFAAGSWKLENQEEQAPQDKAIQDIKSNQFLLDLIKGTDAKFQAKGQMRSTPIYEGGGKVDVSSGFIDRNKYTNPEDIKDLQRFLKNEGYDLGDFGDEGVDGIIENVTNEAIIRYNQVLSKPTAQFSTERNLPPLQPSNKPLSLNDIQGLGKYWGKNWTSTYGQAADRAQGGYYYTGKLEDGKDILLSDQEYQSLKK